MNPRHYLPTVLFLVLTLSACTSAQYDDQRNETLAAKAIKAANPALADSHITVTSFQGTVLVTGQVPADTLIPEVTKLVEPLRNVKRVHNELVVAGPTSVFLRTNDSWLTTKVASQLLAHEDIDSKRIKVITENSAVYLMGRVTRQEADMVVEVARTIHGVQKVVKVFEYIN